MQLRYCMIFLVGFTLGGLLVYIADDTIIPNYNFVQKTPLHLELTTTSATTPEVSENVITKPYEEPPRKIIYEPFDPNHNRSVHIQLVSDRDKIAFWKEYAQYHDEMFKRDKKRFILWTKSVGWGLGNNINGLITTILLSLLTDRAFLADDSYVTEKLVDWPIAWQWHKVKDRLPEMPSTPIYFQNADCFFSNAGSQGSETQYKDLEEMFPGDMIRMETNCPAFHWMSQNEKYIPKLRKLGMIPDGMPTIYNSFYVATWISNVFLKTTINSTVQDSLNKFIADHHFRDSYVIGVQLRFGNDGTSFIQPHEINGALKCAVDLASGKEKVHLFIASNSETAYQAFSYTFGSENVSYVPGAVQSFDMQTVTDGMLKIFLDNFLLSEADELIVTPMSTFGSVAAFRGGILPMVVKGEGCYPAKMEAGPGGNPPTWDTLLLW